MTAALRVDAKKPYGDVKYADPGYQSDGVKRYPLDSEEHCRAAWSYINQAKNAAKYSPEKLKLVKGRIRAALKRYGVEMSDDRGDEVEVEYRRDLPAMCTRAFDFDTPPGDGRTLEGYAAVFGHSARISAHGGDFDEEIMPGAFTRSLAARTPVLLFDHGKDPRIGGAPIGTIDTIAEDSRGLHVRARLFEHPDIDRIREPIAKGAIKGMSFRFQVPDKGDKWEPGRHRGGYDKRSILDADVYEVGPVVFPAYDQTTVSVRSLLSTMAADEIRALAHELEAHLRLAVDLEDSTGRPGARSAGGGEEGDEDQEVDVPTLSSTDSRLFERAHRALGVLPK